MHRQDFVATSQGKYYLEVKCEPEAVIFLSIAGKQAAEHYVLFLQSQSDLFIIRNPARQLRIELSSAKPFEAALRSRRRDKTLREKAREVLSTLRFGQAALQSVLHTMESITVTRLIESRVDLQLAKMGVSPFISTPFGDAEAAIAHVDDVLAGDHYRFTDDPIATLFEAYGAATGGDVFLLLDGRRLVGGNRRRMALWMMEHFGEPAMGEGPAWDLLRANPGLGAITHGPPAAPKLDDWRHSGRTEKFLDAIGLPKPVLASLGGLPPVALVSRAALDGLRALNLSKQDLDGGLASHALLETALIPMIEKSGKLVAELRLSRSRLLEWQPLEAAPYISHRQLPPPEGRKVCLFVGLLDNEGRFAPHALTYMNAVREAGYLVLALGVAIGDPNTAQDPGAEVADGFAARANAGYDFALWAAGLRNNPDVWKAESLLLVNDSVFVAPSRLGPVFERLARSTADVTGLTPCWLENYHLQSYFLSFNRKAIESPALFNFWDNVVSWSDKFRIISAYEVGMTGKLMASGLSCNSLFQPKHGENTRRLNPSIHLWREILDDALPFVKVQLLRDNPTGEDIADWQDVLTRNGFDVNYIRHALQRNIKT